MYGGRILGQGTYGCVFQPALRCQGSTSPSDSRTVGKITSSLDAHNELDISQYLKSLPGSSNYTIPVDTDSCTPSPHSKHAEKDLDKCDLLDTIELDKTIQLIMPWGGLPVTRINLNPTHFDFFKFFENILAVGAFLVTNDICHFDIWDQNILVDTHALPKLIDFGFAFRPSTLTDADIHTRWREIGFEHDTETPEVTLMLGMEYEQYMIPYITANNLEESKPAVQRLVSLCDVVPSQWTSELCKWSEDSQSFQQKNWLSCWKVYWPGFDAWAIGAVLLEILEIQMTVPGFTHSETWKTRGEDVKKIIRGLCRGHPAYRIDAAEALSLWTNGAHPLIASESVGSDWVSQKILMRNPHQ